VALLAAGGGVAVAATAPEPATPDPVGPYVIGGHEPSQPYPGLASLQLTHPVTGERDFHTCAAKLYSGLWAYTNAHCVTLDDASPYPADWQLHVRVGSPDRTSGGVVANVVQVVPHQLWAWGAIPGQPVADIAMLRLDRYVDLPPLGIAPRPPAVGQSVRLVGWGITEPDLTGPLPATLRELDARRLPAGKCAAGAISGGEICVSSPHGDSGACYGDSGGPGLTRVGGRWMDAGGLSRGTAADAGCGTAPDIATDIGYYRAWMFHVARTGTTPTPPVAKPARANLRRASGLNWATGRINSLP
jgi:secreted trypsin-like serine protease